MLGTPRFTRQLRRARDTISLGIRPRPPLRITMHNTVLRTNLPQIGRAIRLIDSSMLYQVRTVQEHQVAVVQPLSLLQSMPLTVEALELLERDERDDSVWRSADQSRCQTVEHPYESFILDNASE